MTEKSEISANYEAMMICSDCFEIYGPWHYKGEVVGGPDINLFQYCGRDCPSQNRNPDMLFKEAGEAKWPRFGFNTVVELCYCCGQEVLESGSKWSVWFCKECKERVVQFNTIYPNTIIPVGRHSIMSGYRLSGKDTESSAKIEAFANNINQLFGGIDHLDKWRKTIMSENFRHIRCQALRKEGWHIRDVLLNEYLQQSENLPDKSKAFQEMCEFFGAREDISEQ